MNQAFDTPGADVHACYVTVFRPRGWRLTLSVGTHKVVFRTPIPDDSLREDVAVRALDRELLDGLARIIAADILRPREVA